MALKNKELLFIVKLQNQARAVIKEMRGDLNNVAKTANEASKSINNLASKTGTLKDKFGLTQAGIRKVNETIYGYRQANLAAVASVSKLTITQSKLLDTFDFLRDAAGALGPKLLKGLGFAALTASVAAFGLVLKGTLTTFAEFDAQAAKVNAVAFSGSGAIDKYAGQYGALRETAKQLGLQTEFTATQASSGLENLVRAGFTAAQAIQTIRPALDLATTGSLTLAQSSEYLVSIMGGYRIAAEDASRVTDILAFVNASTATDIQGLGEALAYAGSTSNSLGISLNETAAAIGILGDAGTKNTAAGTAIREIQNDLLRLATGNATKKAKEVLLSLKLDKDQIDPRKVGLIGAIETLKKAGIDAGQTLSVFEARGTTPFTILASALPKLKKVFEESQNILGYNAKQADIIRDNLATSIKRLKSAYDNLIISIGDSGFGAAVQAVVQFLTTLIVGLTGASVEGYKFGDAVGVIVYALRTVIQLLPVAGAAFLAFRANAILGPAVKTGLTSLLPLLASIPARLAALGSSGLVAFRALIASIGGFSGALRSIATVAFTVSRAILVAFLTNPIGIFLAAIAGVIALFVVFRNSVVSINGETASLGNIMAQVGSDIYGVVKSIIGFFGSMFDSVVSVFTGIELSSSVSAQSVFDGFKKTINFIIGAFVSLGQSALSTFRTIGSAGLQVFGALSKASSGDFTGALDASKSAIATVANGSGNIGKIVGTNAGKDFVGGYFDSVIKGAAKRGRDTSKALKSGIPNIGGKSLLDSPDDLRDNGVASEDEKAKKKGATEAETAAKKLPDLIKKENIELASQEKLLGLVGTARDKLVQATEFLDKLGVKGVDVDKLRTGSLEGLSTADRQLTLSILDRKAALVESQRVDAVAVDIYERTTAAQRTLNDVIAAGVQLLKKNPEAQAEVTKATNVARQALKEYLDPLTSLRQETEDLVRLSQLRPDQIAIETRAQESYNTAIKEGVDVTTALQRAQEGRGAFTTQAVAQARIALGETLAGIDREIALSGVLEQNRDRETKILEYQAELRRQGVNNLVEQARLINVYTSALERQEAATIAARRDSVAGVAEGLRAVSDEFTNFRDQSRGLITDTFTTLRDSLVGFLDTGKLSFGSLIQTVRKQLLTTVANTLLGSATKALGGLLNKGSDKATSPLGAATSVLDQYLQSKTPIPVLVQNIGALSGTGGDGVGVTLADIFGDKSKDFEIQLGGALTGITNSVAGAGKGFSSGFSNALGSIISALGSKGGGGGGGTAGLISAGLNIASSFFADGGIMTNRGKIPLQKYSRGGIANSPQVSVFGEGDTPEAYVPVPSGKIPVQLSGLSGGSTNNTYVLSPSISVGVTNNGGNDSGEIDGKQANAISKAMQEEVKIAMTKFVSKESRPGGLLAAKKK